MNLDNFDLGDYDFEAMQNGFQQTQQDLDGYLSGLGGTNLDSFGSFDSSLPSLYGSDLSSSFSNFAPGFDNNPPDLKNIPGELGRHDITFFDLLAVGFNWLCSYDD